MVFKILMRRVCTDRLNLELDEESIGDLVSKLRKY